MNPIIALNRGSLAGIMLLAAACSPSAEDHAANNAAGAAPPTEAEAAAAIDKVESTFTSGNAQTIMANYAPGAVFFDAMVAEPTDDRATATKWTEGFVAMKPSAFSPGARRIQVLDADTFISSGVGTIDATVENRPAKLQMRYTDVYQKQADGTWQVVHEHLSVPPKGEAATAPAATSAAPAGNAANAANASTGNTAGE
ncbi:YybH family protein [Sphingomonas cavernae]|uniref:DUF4440 domain-containing protein n=1 Tax=Sphingomonas cavernae TaxID=2320861 RepID=A0A418WSG0_9SPHN|nr:DUF4440 domain-containing protein [Sphingomonas cavernae]RJF94099.1 DUF4440 domain-containing protein [Sphingomonas cavernae]